MEQKNTKKIVDWLQNGSINIFGLPFSGKDTHGHELAKIFNAALISGGDILRSAQGLNHIKAHIAKGHLAPTNEYLSIVLPYLSGYEFSGKPLILSSVGRWHGEESSVIEAAKSSGHPIKAVIYLSISEAESKKRWLLAERGREDDAEEEILNNRFKEFHEKTMPVIDHYRKKGLLIEVDGLPPKDKVLEDILSGLDTFASSKKAPDFKLPDQDGKLHSLKNYAGKWLVLYFYPKDDTPGCTTEACSFRDERELIAKLGKAEVVGVSKDSVASHKKFAEKYKLNFTILSDESAEVLKAYGAWTQKSMFGKKYMGINRSTVIIDPAGNIVITYPDVDPKKHAAQIIDDLKILQAN